MKSEIQKLVILIGFVWALGYSIQVKVEGIGATKETALNNAMRNAVNESAKKLLGEKANAEKKEEIKAKLLMSAGGYVSNHMVLSTTEEFGMTKIEIMAEVETGKIEEDLVAQKLLYELRNKPRLMVVLEERAEGQEMFEKTATAKFEEYLLQKGFKIIDPAQLKEVKEAEKLKGLADPDLAQLGFRMGADLVVRGGVSAGKPTPKKIYDKDFYTVPIQLNAKIVRADNAEIIAVKTKHVKKNSQEEFSAAQFGLEVGGSALADELMKELYKFWQSESYIQAKAELIVTGLGSTGIQELENKLRSQAFIKGTQLRYLEKNSALIDIELIGSVQDLRETFEKDPSFGVLVTGISANRISIKMGKGMAKVDYEYTGPGLEIDSFSVREIFPSRVKYYENNPLASIHLSSKVSAPISQLELQVMIPRIMDLPATAKIPQILPSETKEISLKLILNSAKLLEFSESQNISAQVKVSYIQGGKKQTRELTAPVQVYDRNTMDWVEPKTLGTFVTYRDPAINTFARNALSQVQEIYSIHKTIQEAMSIMEALKQHGIKYVKDPAGAPGNRVLDRVSFPRETLKSKTGDCDDTSVLVAALLTAVGIETAIVSYPDHVLTMFNTGIFQKNIHSLGADSKKVIPHRGTLWVPLETTLISKGFLEAWEAASEDFYNAVSDGEHLSVIELNESWKLYAAAPIQGPEIPTALKDLGNDIDKEAKRILSSIQDSYKEAIQEIEQEKTLTPKQQKKLGILYIRSGEYQKAIDQFQKVSEKEKTPENLSNLASSILVSGEEKKAIEIFEKLLEKQGLAGAAVNRALAYYLKAQSDKDIESFIKALKEANAMLPENEKLDQYLGMSLEEGKEGERASDGREKQEKQIINKRRMKELIRQRVLTETKSSANVKKNTLDSQGKLVPYGGVRGADPEQVAEVIDLLYWYH